MTFYSNFSDLNGKRYEIEIHSDGGGEVDIVMGGNPCTITTSSTGIFTPIKSRSASLEIVTKEWYFDLYEPTSRGTSVKIYEYDSTQNLGVGKVLFRGYLTPCSYSQNFTYLDTITLEAVDGISTAKDFKWNNDGNYKNFIDIILPIIKRCNYRGNLYVPRSYESINSSTINTDCLQILQAASSNFIDDNQERTPWTEYEVVEEIMKFLNFSLIPDGDDVWLVDYRALANGAVTYSVYDIENLTFSTTITSNFSTTSIDLSLLAGGTSQISIDDIYNKIEISDNLYKIEEIAPDIFDDGIHISVTDEAGLGLDESKWTSYPTKKFLWWTTQTGTGQSSASSSTSDTITGYDFQTICRLSPDSGWKHRYYRMSDLSEILDEQGYFDQVTFNDPNATFKSTPINAKINTHCALIQHYAHLKNAGPNNVPASIDWSDILTFFILGPTMTPTALGNYSNYELPVLEYTIDEEIGWKPSSGISWITIKGSLLYQNGADYDKKKTLSIVNTKSNVYTTYPVNEAVDGLPSDKAYIGFGRSKNDPDYGNGFQCWKMSLQIGDKYWAENYNSSTHKWSGYWTTTPSTFYLRYNNNPDGENQEIIQTFQWMDTVNTNDYKDKVGVDAYAIKIDSSDSNAPDKGRMKLTIYSPSLLPTDGLDDYTEDVVEALGSWTLGFGALAPVVYVKGFELGYVYTDTNVWYNNHEDNTDKDKVYIGRINDNFIQDFDGLEFKLNTSIKDKPISRSYVRLAGGYLDKMKHIVGDESKAQEYNVIDSYLDHHSERKVIYEANVHGYFTPSERFNKTSLGNGVLVIDTQSYDVRNDNNRIKFITY